ncbi:hypothetical protein BHF71_02865 [Vulcanibacillus modesticaldus]|uniref:Flagellar protein FliS n=1 Tax=Vulcanibacillus modesticaldus TaxID=337097 RepID=A0A1D2YT92_9BACI|nr:hypothetical protein [Vulcanibacillus modesticaldus]OEF98885.1 hypothetical protein BHF71_02865 [Vulcanibacillus modesticaldus]
MLKNTNIGQLLEEFTQKMTITINNWRNGNDQQGLQNFTQGMQILENILKFYPNEQKNDPIILSELRFLLEKLLVYLQNKDLIGITDTIEFELLPLLTKWKKEVEIDGEKR